MIKWININLHTDLIKYVTDPQEHATNNTRGAKNKLINQGVKIDGVQYYTTYQELILSNIFTESDIYDNYSYPLCVNWEIKKITETHPKKVEFNIDKPETGLKKIDFNIDVIDDQIDDTHNEVVVYPSNDLIEDDYSNIESQDIQQEQSKQNNSFYTLVDNKLQLSFHLEDPNKTDDWKTTNNHEGELVVAYDTNTRNNTLRLRTFNVLYIRPNDNCNGHLIFKLSTKQISVTTKYQPMHVPEDLIKVINEIDSFTNKI